MLGQNQPGTLEPGFYQRVEKTLAVSVIEEDRTRLVAARHHMIHCVLKLDPNRPGHETAAGQTGKARSSVKI
jgi:hypothetical protein